MGQVAQPVLKDDAEKVVKRIEGVTRVKNEIEVLLSRPTTTASEWRNSGQFMEILH